MATLATTAVAAADDATPPLLELCCMWPTTVRETSGQPTTTRRRRAALPTATASFCKCVCRYLTAYVHTHAHTNRVMHWYSFVNSLSERAWRSLSVSPSHSLSCLVCFVFRFLNISLYCTHTHPYISLPCWPFRLVWLRPKTRHCVVFHFPLRSLCTTWRAALLRRCLCCFSVFALAIPCVVFLEF